MQFRSELIFSALPEANAELQALLGIKVYILPVSDTDHFYTDGGSVGATYRIEMPDSSLNYLLSDGTVRMAMSSLLSVHEVIIRRFIQEKTRI
jgi:hypothetical protein